MNSEIRGQPQQRVVIRDVFPATAQAIDALRNETADIVANAGRAPAIREYTRRRARQAAL